MNISHGSKIRNLIGYALNQVQKPNVSQITWSGHGKAFGKTISCAETFRNKAKGWHRITELKYHRTEVVWEPLLEGLERLKVNKDEPAVSILLSKHPVKYDKTTKEPEELKILLKQALKNRHQKESGSDRRSRTDSATDNHHVNNSSQNSASARKHKSKQHPSRTQNDDVNSDVRPGNRKERKNDDNNMELEKDRTVEPKKHRFTFKPKNKDTKDTGMTENVTPES